MSEIKILVVDDHPIVRDGLTAVLSTQPDFNVIGEAGNGLEAIEFYKKNKPDIVLTDLEMPELDGIKTIEKLKEIDSNSKILVLTVFDTDERILESIQAGAQGYLLKDSPRDKIFNAIRIIYQGGNLLHPVAISKLMNNLQKEKTQTEVIDEPLTNRELDVLKLLSEGNANKQISVKLNISERTVKFHVSHIISKLGVENRTEAVSVAIKKGII